MNVYSEYEAVWALPAKPRDVAKFFHGATTEKTWGRNMGHPPDGEFPSHDVSTAYPVNVDRLHPLVPTCSHYRSIQPEGLDVGPIDSAIAQSDLIEELLEGSGGQVRRGPRFLKRLVAAGLPVGESDDGFPAQPDPFEEQVGH